MADQDFKYIIQDLTNIYLGQEAPMRSSWKMRMFLIS